MTKPRFAQKLDVWPEGVGDRGMRAAIAEVFTAREDDGLFVVDVEPKEGCESVEGMRDRVPISDDVVGDEADVVGKGPKAFGGDVGGEAAEEGVDGDDEQQRAE